jgi:hypothetical protein
MVTLDRIRLTGLLRKSPVLQGFSIERTALGHHRGITERRSEWCSATLLESTYSRAARREGRQEWRELREMQAVSWTAA